MENQLLSKYPREIGRVVLIVDKDAVIREMLLMALRIEKSYYGYHISSLSASLSTHHHISAPGSHSACSPYPGGRRLR